MPRKQHQPTGRIRVWVQSFKDRPNFMLQWIEPDSGKRRTESAKTDDPEAAEQARADKEYELNNGLYQERSKITWERFRQMFMEEYAAGLRERSQEKFETVFDVFEAEMKPGNIGTINERTVSRFVQALRSRERPGEQKGLAPVTIRNYLVALRTALTWAKDQRLISECPKFPRIKVPKKKPQPVPAEAFERLLNAEQDPAWRAFMACGWLAGLRLSEVIALQWEPSPRRPYVDFEESKIVLPAEFAKSDEDQWVPLHPQLRQLLEALPRNGRAIFAFVSAKTGRPLSRSGHGHHILAIARKAHVKLSMHKLRKGFGCRVARQLGKGNAPILHRLMRHSSMQITMDYYASVDDALQDAIEELK